MFSVFKGGQRSIEDFPIILRRQEQSCSSHLLLVNQTELFLMIMMNPSDEDYGWLSSCFDLERVGNSCSNFCSYAYFLITRRLSVGSLRIYLRTGCKVFWLGTATDVLYWETPHPAFRSVNAKKQPRLDSQKLNRAALAGFNNLSMTFYLLS